MIDRHFEIRAKRKSSRDEEPEVAAKTRRSVGGPPRTRADGARIVCQVVDMPILQLDYHILTPALLVPTAATGICVSLCSSTRRFLLRYARSHTSCARPRRARIRYERYINRVAAAAYLHRRSASASQLARVIACVRLVREKGTSMYPSRAMMLRATVCAPRWKLQFFISIIRPAWFIRADLPRLEIDINDD